MFFTATETIWLRPIVAFVFFIRKKHHRPLRAMEDY